MNSENNHQLDTIGVTAQLEGTSLNVGVRTRLTTAIDRLAGNLVDVPNWFLDAWKARKVAANQAAIELTEARSQVAVELVKAEGAAAVAKLMNLNEAGSRILDGFLADQSRRQNSRVAVLIEASEELKRLPYEEEGASEADQLDDDWLSMFSDFAERASSSQLQQLWGRILAGEIRKPNTFSRSTLRVISEMDKRYAESYERILSYRINDYFISEGNSEYRQDLFMAEELGLIFGPDGTLGLPLKEEEDGHVYVFSGGYCLKIKLTKKRPLSMGPYVGIARMSRVGKELASIIPDLDLAMGLRKLAETLFEKSDSIQLYKIVGRNQGELIETIKASDTNQSE